ncbi:ribosomal protein S18 acetylase RimI-like enzyme [Variovorax boronicumulans]|uniref:GNAT family N-acetyltransferase n=1 Tax=Variovorax boronicumulans TaxID=436515 RepID=UPI0027864157|nr:GNAT family N-acetyltransferase [Variovorax boronicumulans]MDQ0070959.1 ribosomal protein S18 acetylase RimI-like enzyme [Variovorax boronicumulans]
MTKDYLLDRMYRHVDTADEGASRQRIEQTTSRAPCEMWGYAKQQAASPSQAVARKDDSDGTAHLHRDLCLATQRRSGMKLASNDIASDPAAADAVRLRRFEPGDVPAAHALSSALNWPHRIEDWQFAQSLGQGVVAERDGKVVGTALSWQFGTNYATLGLVIVAPELQGQRIGNRLMEAVLDLLAGRNVLLHATAAGVGLYERLGFVTTGEIEQHQGVLATLPTVAGRNGDHLRPLAAADIEALIAMDALGAGMPRGELLRRLFSQERTVVLERGGQAAGFAVLRRYGHGQAVGPVSAPDFDAARLLIADCCRHAEGFLRIDVDATSGLPPWLESLGLPRTNGVSIMVRGKVPERGPAHGSWALVTQAIG